MSNVTQRIAKAWNFVTGQAAASDQRHVTFRAGATCLLAKARARPLPMANKLDIG